MLDERSQIALGRPELPPEREVSSQRYLYHPCPLEDDVPMPNHIFFHYFYQPAGHYRGKWLHRLPKKLKESIFSSREDITVGWGVHIIESPDYYVISILVLVGLVISGIASVIWAIFTKDVQGAFTIGSYLVAMQTAWMATLYFGWAQ